MAETSIRLDAQRSAYVDAQVADGRYATADDYVAALIDAEAKAAAQERLEQLLIEGLDSEELEWTPELQARLRDEFLSEG